MRVGSGASLSAWAVGGIPEIVSGDNLPEIIAAAVGPLEEGDIVMVTSKIVSKAEGRQVQAADREDAITAETVRVVATRPHANGVTRIVENRLGLVLAAAGVDSSNTPDGTVLLLPVDPDASARAICAALRQKHGVRVGVVITDTLGRAWRLGQTDIAIGAAGLRVLDDLRGTTDSGGRRLDATIVAVADQLAGTADLVKGKSSGMPVAVIRGQGRLVGDLDEPGARTIVRASEDDLFRLGSTEAYEQGLRDGRRYRDGQKPSGGQGLSDALAEGESPTSASSAASPSA